MDQSDIQFRKNCQFYYIEAKKSLKNGNLKEAREIIKKMELALSEWEGIFRSSRFKLGLLRNTHTDLIKLEKRASYKLDRRQQKEDDSK